jgi:hypothetical protein
VPRDEMHDFAFALDPAWTAIMLTDSTMFLGYVRSNVDKVSYGSAGIGTAQHIYMELFKQQMGLEMLHVPYKGSAPAVTDLIAGRIQAVLDFGPSVLLFLGSGMLRLIAISTRERSRSAPDVPTMMESGVPNFDASTWFAIHGPGGMPAATVEGLAAEIKAAMQNPPYAPVLKRLAPTRLAAAPMSYVQCRHAIRSSSAKSSAGRTSSSSDRSRWNAGRSRVGKNTHYYYFRSNEGLFFASLDREKGRQLVTRLMGKRFKK